MRLPVEALVEGQLDRPDALGLILGHVFTSEGQLDDILDHASAGPSSVREALTASQRPHAVRLALGGVSNSHTPWNASGMNRSESRENQSRANSTGRSREAPRPAWAGKSRFMARSMAWGLHERR